MPSFVKCSFLLSLSYFVMLITQLESTWLLVSKKSEDSEKLVIKVKFLFKLSTNKKTTRLCATNTTCRLANKGRRTRETDTLKRGRHNIYSDRITYDAPSSLISVSLSLAETL